MSMKKSDIFLLDVSESELLKHNKVSLIITKDTNGKKPDIITVLFRDPVFNLDHKDLLNLRASVGNVLDDLNNKKSKSTELTVKDSGKLSSEIAVPANMGKFEKGVRGMFDKIKGQMSEEEKKTASDAFGLIDKLLGRK